MLMGSGERNRAYLELVSGGCGVLSIVVGVGIGYVRGGSIFFSSFFFLGAGSRQEKTKGPRRTIKRERFSILQLYFFQIGSFFCKRRKQIHLSSIWQVNRILFGELAGVF